MDLMAGQQANRLADKNLIYNYGIRLLKFDNITYIAHIRICDPICENRA